MPAKKPVPPTPATPLPKIGRPATFALAHEGVTTLEQVAQLAEPDLLSMHGVGPKALRLLKEALAAQGLSFAAPASRPKSR